MASTWEHLIVLSQGSSNGPVQRLVAVSAEAGEQVIAETWTPRSMVEAFDRLGGEGWEMVGPDPGDTANAYWFRRASRGGDPQVY